MSSGTRNFGMTKPPFASLVQKTLDEFRPGARQGYKKTGKSRSDCDQETTYSPLPAFEEWRSLEWFKLRQNEPAPAQTSAAPSLREKQPGKV